MGRVLPFQHPWVKSKLLSRTPPPLARGLRSWLLKCDMRRLWRAFLRGSFCAFCFSSTRKETLALLNGPEPPGINLTQKRPRKKVFGIPGKQLKSNPESRFPAERHTGNVLLGILLSYFPGIPKTFFRGLFWVRLIPGGSGPFRRARISQFYKEGNPPTICRTTSLNSSCRTTNPNSSCRPFCLF